MQSWFNIYKSTNVTLNDKSHMIISVDMKKLFDKIQNTFHDKVPEKLEIEDTSTK